MTDTDKELAKLRKEVADLRAALTPSPYPSEKEVAAHKDAVHQMAERRMANATYFSPGDLRKMREAAPDNVCRDLARDGRAPLGPRSIIPSSPTSSNVRAPINNSGWQHDAPIGPPAGISYVDAQLDAQDRRDRAERIQREAAVQRAMKAKGG